MDRTQKTVPVTVNGKTVETSARTLSELVDHLHPNTNRVATALNGTFVGKDARAATVLSNGDVIEVLSARQGG